MSSNKKNEIVLMNTALCLLVIFIHIASAPVSALSKNSIQFFSIMVPWRLSAFVVQGFLFLSALKLFLKDMSGFSYKTFILKRLKVIFLPYACWVMVYYLFFCGIGYFGFSFADYIKYLINGSLVSPFYFIVTIMQFYLLMPLWIWLIKKVQPHILTVSSFAVMILFKLYIPMLFNRSGIDFQYFDRIFATYLFYWIAGCCAGSHYHTFRLYIEKYYFSELLMFICAAVFDIWLSYRVFVYGTNIAYLEYIHVLYCVSAISFMYTLSIRLSKTFLIKSRLISGIDSASYYIFLMHCLVINIINIIMKKLGITDIGTAFILRFIIVYSVSITACILYVKAKKRILNYGGKTL